MAYHHHPYLPVLVLPPLRYSLDLASLNPVPSLHCIDQRGSHEWYALKTIELDETKQILVRVCQLLPCQVA